MSYEANTGLGVYTQYGTRATGGSVGASHTKDNIKQVKIRFTGESLNSGFIPEVVIPQGARFLRYVLRVDEAFSLTGTSPTVIFGGTAPATNGVVLSETELENVGTKVPSSTGAGTWSTSSSTGTTAAQAVALALGGTSPVVASTQGKAVLTAEYLDTRVS